MRNFPMGLLALSTVLALSTGCSSSREVEVSGETTSSSAGALSSAVQIEIYEMPGAEGAEQKLLTKLTLPKPGPFTTKIDVEGNKIRLFAVADVNNDGACTAGELLAEKEVTIDSSDKVEKVDLALASGACPVAKTP
jgi:hypothetical protein